MKKKINVKKSEKKSNYQAISSKKDFKKNNQTRDLELSDQGRDDIERDDYLEDDSSDDIDEDFLPTLSEHSSSKILQSKNLDSYDLTKIDESTKFMTSSSVSPSKVSSIDDPLAKYLREVSKYKLLTIEEEKELTKKLKETGDLEVAKTLVTANLRLVVKIAMEYRHAYHNVIDLIQEGNIGLMKAVSKYDPDKGAKLSYYASWWIRSYILKYILDNFRLIKIGTTVEQKKLFYNLMKEKQRLESLGETPTIKLLANNLDVSEDAVVLMEKRLGHVEEVALDRPLDNHSEGAGRATTLADILPSDSHLEEDLENEQGIEILNKNLGNFLAELKPRDLEIFKKRLLSEVPTSLQAIADEYGVSRERIRQIEERLIEKLKVYMSQFLR